MHNSRNLTTIFRKLTLLIIVFLLSAVLTNCAAIADHAEKTSVYSDEAFYFSVDLPDDWEITQAKEDDASLRLSSISPDGRNSISIYAVEAANNIVLEKLADASQELFENSGSLIDTRKIRKYLIFVNQIEKTYQSGPGNTILLFDVATNLGYILRWQSLDENSLDLYLSISKSFTIDIPFTKTVKGWFNDAGGWLKGIIISLLFIGALFLLGTTGLYLRRGIKIKKSLNKARSDALLKGLLLNTNYYKFKKKSTLYIVLPVLFWMSAYGILFMILPLGQFYGSLFVLIAPILGFFGVFFVPSEDLSDYF